MPSVYPISTYIQPCAGARESETCCFHRLAFVGWHLFCYHPPMAVTPVILDVDPGHDDAVALMLACGAPELEVRAVTTVAGNVSLGKTTRNALRVLSLIG